MKGEEGIDSYAPKDNERHIELLKMAGLIEAVKIQSQVSEMDDTSIMLNEVSIPAFDPDKHQYLDWEIGQVVSHEGQVWKLIQPYDSTIYKEAPMDLRAHWGLCHTKEVTDARPYVAPLGTSGMYMKDECCTEDGKTYRSLIDNNVWPPSGYPEGWEEETIF